MKVSAGMLWCNVAGARVQGLGVERAVQLFDAQPLPRTMRSSVQLLQTFGHLRSGGLSRQPPPARHALSRVLAECTGEEGIVVIFRQDDIQQACN